MSATTRFYQLSKLINFIMEAFSADKITIWDLLRWNTRYRVPAYQRPYSWWKDFVSNFWAYLTDGSENYFLWTVVLNNEYLWTEGVKDIVDWQQRFITICILFAVIRDLFKDLWDETKSDAVQKNFISFKNDDWEDEGYKLTTWAQIRSFFETNIQREGANVDGTSYSFASNEEKRVIENYKYLKSLVKESISWLGASETVDYLKSVREKLASLNLVYIEVSSEYDAYTFFETINATGMKLSTADILKNLLFKKTTKGRERIQQNWDDILEILKSDDWDVDITRFIRHFWISKHEKVGDKKIYSSIKNAIDVDGAYSGDYDQFVLELKSYAWLYKCILRPDAQYISSLLGLTQNQSDRIRRCLFGLKKLGAVQPNPLLLTLLKKLSVDKFRTEEVFSLFSIIEHFTFVYATVWKSPSKLEKIYSKNAIAISNSADLVSLKKYIGSCIVDLRAEFPKKEEYLLNLLEIKYEKDSKSTIGYLFGKINHDGKGEVELANVNIEHIFPQNPTAWSELATQLPSIAPYINDLGNLVPVSPALNREASNKAVVEKLDIYKKSRVPMVLDIVNLLKSNWSKWTKEEIQSRSKDFAEKSWWIFSKGLV